MPTSIKRKLLALATQIIPLPPKRKSNILMYHRVLDPKNSKFMLEPGMYVTPDTFEKQIQYASRTYSILPLEEYISLPHDSKKLKNSFSITFDDGWLDFYTYAYPILKKYDVPACVFLPTSFIGTNRIMWTEEVALLKTGFESRKDIEKNHLNNEIIKKTNQNFSFTQTLSQVISSFKNVSEEIRDTYISTLKTILSKYTPVQDAPLYMNWEQIQEIQSSSKITFGSHSHTHMISTKIDDDELLKDITLSLEQLKLHNVRNNKIFCYPNQSRSQRTDLVLEKVGFEASLGKLNNEEKGLRCRPICFERIGIHEDITTSTPLFKLRLLGY